MKRDWDLIRKLLTDVEEGRDVLAEIPDAPKWTSQNQAEYQQEFDEYLARRDPLIGHLELLIDTGYIQGLKISIGMDSSVAFGGGRVRLTMAGHDLLATIRSKQLWETIKSTAKAKGVELTFEAVKMLGPLILAKILKA